MTSIHPVVRRDPTTTLFNSLSTSFKGFGVTLRLIPDNMDENIALRLDTINFTFAHVLIAVPDPGFTVLNIDNTSDMDLIFSEAAYSKGGGGQDNDGNDILSPAQRFFRDVAQKNLRLVLTFLIPPSWLLPDDSKQLTGERELYGYANFILSGLLWVRQFGITADMVEVFHKPNDESVDTFGWISPSDMIRFLTHLRALSINRNITTPAVKFLGLGLSQVFSKSNKDTYDPYTQALVTARNSLDFFSIHAYENSKDEAIYNAGTHEGRILLKEMLEKNVTQMSSINSRLERVATMFGTRATIFPYIKYINSPSENDGKLVTDASGSTDEYAIRVVENICAVMRHAFTFAIYGGGLSPWVEKRIEITEDGTETEKEVIREDKSLFASNGTKKPVADVFTYLCKNMPIPSDLYVSEELNVDNDKTVKQLLLTSRGDRFFFILCRPYYPDTLAGRLRLVINNPLWSTSYETSDVKIDSYPSPSRLEKVTTVDEDGTEVESEYRTTGVDLSAVFIKSQFSQGSLTFDLRGLPYGGAVLFFSGKVNLKPVFTPPPPAVTPTPTPPAGKSPVVMSTILQMNVHYGEPTPVDYAPGTIFYDSRFKKVKVFFDGSWIDTEMLTYY